MWCLSTMSARYWKASRAWGWSMMHSFPSGLKNSAPNSQNMPSPEEAPPRLVAFCTAHFACWGSSFQSVSLRAKSTNSLCVQSFPGSRRPAAWTALRA